ncbi:unnamed protein product, partial [Acanthocheilonema viteae]
KNKHEKINDGKDIYGKSDVRRIEQEETIKQLKPNGASIVVHPEIHIPAMISDTDEEHKKEMNEGNRSLDVNKTSPQIKLDKGEVRIFLRETGPKAHHSEAVQRPQTASDSESRMIVGEDPRLYYTDSECVTSHGKHFQRQFLMRVNISEDRSSILPGRLLPHQSSSSSTDHAREAQFTTTEVQHTLHQPQLPPGETGRIHCKHTLV